MKFKNIARFAIILWLFSSSCSNDEIFYLYKHIPNAKWSKENILSFKTDTLLVYANNPCDIMIEISHNSQYPYQNLWLFVQQNLNDSSLITDTLEIEMADIYGKWRGKGTSGLFQLTVPYKSSWLLESQKKYTFSIQHGMRDEPIKGIEKVGVKVIKK